MIETMIALGVVAVFGCTMFIISELVKKVKKEKVNVKAEEKSTKPANKSMFERYCNDYKNDSRKQLAHFILIHERNEREKRGQD